MDPNTSGAMPERADEKSQGPLGSLYANKYKHIFLQYPLNLESGEENHWVRFDVQEIQGVGVKQNEARSEPSRKLTSGGSFIDRIVENTAEKASALVTTALLAPVNIAKSTVNEFLSELGPTLGGIGRELFFAYLQHLVFTAHQPYPNDFAPPLHEVKAT